MNTYYAVRFTKKRGKVNKCLEGKSKAMLKLWALQNTTKTTNTIVFDAYGKVEMFLEGNEYAPEVVNDFDERIINIGKTLAAMM